MSKVPDLGDVDVARLMSAARALKARGVTRPVLETYLDRVYPPKPPPKPPAHGLQLPANLKAPYHQTGGLDGFPANDIFAPGGTPCLAPAEGDLVYVHKITWSKTKRVGGWTGYLIDWKKKRTYFLTHFGSMVKAGPIKYGDLIGVVGTVPNGWWEEHIHEGKHVGIYDPRT